MAITTDNEKLAIMEFGQVFEPGLPLSPGTFDQGHQQQLIWGYPGILWEASALDNVVGADAVWFLDVRGVIFELEARGVEWVL